MNTNDISKFKQLFINEATTLLNSMEGIILELENNPNNIDLIQEVFRVMHTIKGVSGMYGFDHMSELTHHIENVYDLVRNGIIPVNKEILDLTLGSVDQLFILIDDKDLGSAKNIKTQSVLIAKAESIIEKINKSNSKAKVSYKKESSPIVTYNIVLHTPQSIIDRRINIFYTIKDLSEIGEIRSINRLPSSTSDEERWSIFVVGELDDESIEDALMFVYEYCIIKKVAEYDIFNTELIDKHQALIKDEESPVSQQEMESQAMDASPFSTDETKSNIDNANKSQSIIDSIRQNNNRISVDSEKLDHLMYLVSELITTSSQLNLMTNHSMFDTIRSQTEKIDKLSKSFRNNALEIRLIPIRDMVPKFSRLVRDISNDLSKEVEFVTDGMDTELDKSSIDLIAEPLVHMLRNAIDHGIESPEERLESGKNSKGQIRLKAYNSGNNIYIEVSDDGRGLDKDKLYNKAVDIGIIAQGEKLNDKELYNLICHPGFSTAKEVTSISGRGVGMDVVKQKISKMRGELEIRSQKEKGSTFIIKLQQSIAIIDTLLISAEKLKCLLPLTDVEECVQVPYDEVKMRLRHGTLSYEKKLIPFVSLRHLFELENDIPMHAKVVIINKNNTKIAIVTDTIIGQHQAVLKPMGELVKEQREFSAASVLGNGEVAFLLDSNVLQNDIYKS
ncbi:chemotaxis protein CheA [Carboxylicivirga marina]|uniref:Chemotaxis protein CheA n=1 Tax=Carboxylicivirga marina TaxID=2800988 RepID=A0ABS1HGT5_9BACT|nr:chemotaxis protein CheA [Carboxylicivirga marina]MBK3516872.1 chemotaxis protein CheA [Carboxylicivirga marina]